ncbi:MAG TPA: ABC transporter ATP-binding protein [Devosiaceae bacterium]|jgi:multiple sugar transport system ATP-binding protein|nr:ABC transporter ATP-binding protein [Devosiaceae bacterium]
MAAVTLTDISKRWGSFDAIKDLSLVIEDKEFLVLLGPSGCGKTTTMRMIAGLEDPTAGDIYIDDRRVNDVPPRQRDLAMVFQNYGLYPHMTVAQNIGYPLKVQRVAADEKKRRVEAAAERVELEGLLGRYPSELSGGQRQRVALARAIVRTPRIFLMDEPLSNLDAKLRTVMRGELKHLQRELATTTVYVTHDQVEAMTLADRIVIMEHGRIQQMGRPAEIYARPANAFVAGFIGSPPMSLVPGEVAEGQFRHPGGSLPVSCRDGAILLGQHAGDLHLTEPGAGDFAGTVYSSELLGDAALLGIRLGKDMVTLKVAPEAQIEVGASAGVRFDRTRLHLFDAASGERIGAG